MQPLRLALVIIGQPHSPQLSWIAVRGNIPAQDLWRHASLQSLWVVPCLLCWGGHPVQQGPFHSQREASVGPEAFAVALVTHLLLALPRLIQWRGKYDRKEDKYRRGCNSLDTWFPTWGVRTPWRPQSYCKGSANKEIQIHLKALLNCHNVLSQSTDANSTVTMMWGSIRMFDIKRGSSYSKRMGPTGLEDHKWQNTVFSEVITWARDRNNPQSKNQSYN